MKRVNREGFLKSSPKSGRLLGLLCAASLLTCAHAVAAEGGPDIAGYTWADTASGGPGFNYQLNSSAPEVSLGNRPDDSDDSFATIALPFPFPFYGETYDEVDIHSNGGLSFGAAQPLAPSHNCGTLSFDAPSILPYWVDLFPGTTGNDGVFYWNGGVTPNRYFVVEWYQVALYRPDSNYSQSDRLTFEVKLFEDGRIEFHFEDVNGDGNNDNGAEAGILLAGTQPGTDNASILVVSCDTAAVVFDGNAVGFFPPSCEDKDEDGVLSCEGDCDDSDKTIFPGAPELCDGLDNDCDSILPNEEADLDQDGWFVCGDDCDDTDASLNGADVDEDGFSSCTGDCDDNDPNATPVDLDGDGLTGCDGDCNDDDPEISNLDADNDGLSGCEGDCDDLNNTVRPGNGELCDGRDNDCDGEVDENPNCDGRGGEDGDGHDIAYGCIVSCSVENHPSPQGQPALFLILAGLFGLARRRRAQQ